MVFDPASDSKDVADDTELKHVVEYQLGHDQESAAEGRQQGSRQVIEHQLNHTIKEFGFGLKGDSEYVAGYQLNLPIKEFGFRLKVGIKQAVSNAEKPAAKADFPNTQQLLTRPRHGR